jgi:hypothetical protein
MKIIRKLYAFARVSAEVAHAALGIMVAAALFFLLLRVVFAPLVPFFQAMVAALGTAWALKTRRTAAQAILGIAIYLSGWLLVGHWGEWGVYAAAATTGIGFIVWFRGAVKGFEAHLRPYAMRCISCLVN